MENLEELREKWKKLMSKGELEKANEVYEKELFPFVQEKFINAVQAMIKSGKIPTYDLIVVPMGMEWKYPTMLINALKPKQIYFLGSKEAEKVFLDKVIEKTNLKQSQYERDVAEYVGMDLAEIYDKIKKRVEIFKGKKVAVDLTRGKRVMTAGAAIVGDFFGCDLIYIDEDWIDEIKRGVPGTERLVFVKNPLHISGDLEQIFALELFNRYEFVAAQKCLRNFIAKFLIHVKWKQNYWFLKCMIFGMV